MKLTAQNFLTAFVVVAAVAGAQSTPGSQGPAPTPPASSSADAATQDASSIVLAPKQKDPDPPAPDGLRWGDPDCFARGCCRACNGDAQVQSPQADTEPLWGAADLRDIDKPKNEIKRLPKYVVHEKLPPVFRNRDLYTASGLVDLSFQAHPGLNFGNVLGLNTAVAAQMYQDDERLRNMSDLSDTARAMAAGGDRSEGSYILQQSQQTYMRTPDDFGPVGGLGGNSGGWGK